MLSYKLSIGYIYNMIVLSVLNCNFLKSRGEDYIFNRLISNYYILVLYYILLARRDHVLSERDISDILLTIIGTRFKGIYGLVSTPS